MPSRIFFLRINSALDGSNTVLIREVLLLSPRGRNRPAPGCPLGIRSKVWARAFPLATRLADFLRLVVTLFFFNVTSKPQLGQVKSPSLMVLAGLLFLVVRVDMHEISGKVRHKCITYR